MEKFDIPPPDEEELLLAKQVFGDTTDFQSNLSKFNDDFLLEDSDGAADQSDVESKVSEEGEEGKMDHVMNDQLFFVDDGEEQAQEQADMMNIDEESDASDEYVSESDEEESDVAWEDSDDEKLHISVMTTNKTKKLRTSYEETRINGKNYVNRLRAQFEKIYPRPKWVDDESDTSDINSDEDDNSDDDFEQVINGDVNALSKILKTTYNYKESNSKLLPPTTLDILRLKDANITHPFQSAIQSLSFHPSKPLLLTGGYDKTLRVYHIDGKNNHLVTSVFLRNTPIQSCSFYISPNNEEQKILTGGRRRYMHSWDLSNSITNNNNAGTQLAKIDKISRLYGHQDRQKSFEKFKLGHYYNFQTDTVHGIICLQGNNGWINILNSITGMWMLGCKIDGHLVDYCIDYKPVSGKNKKKNGSNNVRRFKTILIVTNTYGEIWEFDLNQHGKIIKRWKDDGGIGITSIQVGGGTNSNHLLSTEQIRSNRWLAIGSESGFVNIYERNTNGGMKDDSSNPKPVATLDQLTTTISTLQFSPDGQMLCIASRAAKDALRLVHLPTFSVFKNWPTSGTPLGKVTSVAFTPHGEMIAVGNEQGKVRLWRLNHY